MARNLIPGYRTVKSIKPGDERKRVNIRELACRYATPLPVLVDEVARWVRRWMTTQRPAAAGTAD